MQTIFYMSHESDNTKQWKINQNTVHNLLSEIFSLDKEVNKKEWKF